MRPWYRGFPFFGPWVGLFGVTRGAISQEAPISAYCIVSHGIYLMQRRLPLVCILCARLASSPIPRSEEGASDGGLLA